MSEGFRRPPGDVGDLPSSPPDDYYDDPNESETCQRCGGSGFYADCPDDLCYGREECIHGDDALCRECCGEGEVFIKSPTVRR